MKILIADDEVLVRRSVILFLSDLGVETGDMEEAGNGLEMLELLKTISFDLAFVDIRMPSMDGLEAIRQARFLSPDTRFYILSGFDDFQYAQEAIRLGVQDYILKPLKRTELEQILENTISAMEQKKADTIRTLKLSVAALMTESEMTEPEDSILLPIPCHPLLIADDVPGDPFSTSELLAEDDEKIIVIPQKKSGRTLLFLFETPQDAGYGERYTEHLLKRYGGSHTLIEGKCITDSRHWPAEYRRMTALADCRYAFGSRKLYKSNLKAPEIPISISMLCEQCEKGLAAFSSSDYAGFTLSCDSLIRGITADCQKYPTAAKNIMDFLSHAYHLEDVSPDTLKNRLSMVAATMAPPPSFNTSQYEDILCYIREHYQENLSLAGLADIFGLSPNYFSSLFKKKAGCTFIHYLTELRLTEGRRLLLETNLTIREIGERIGYYSASFFIRSFKKSEGITPSEYRRLHTPRP